MPSENGNVRPTTRRSSTRPNSPPRFHDSIHAQTALLDTVNRMSKTLSELERKYSEPVVSYRT
ncbi:hypothetical protein MPER_07280 [Moniliophthora perniciosa FA553]|nr:hypothetical protein MPER_07280 [Moniliophthora perniciosa FA553]